MIKEVVSVGINMICSANIWMYVICIYIYIYRACIILMVPHPHYIQCIFPFQPSMTDKP